MKKILMGNEAVALSLYLNGVNVVTGYPGTPSTEVIETLKNFKDDDFYVEWSTNEKVALEVAAGASISGARTVVTMKQVGLNVAADPLLSLSMIGVEGGMIIYVADDPGPHSSQTEQDTRNFARFCNLPIFDPSSPKEAFELIGTAFEISEKYKIPVIFRMTTRVCHSNEDIEFEFERKKRNVTGFSKDPKWVILPSLSYKKHIELEEKLQSMSYELGIYNKVHNKGKIGIITSGVSYYYVLEAIKDFDDLFSVMKVTISHPIDKNLIIKFAKDKESIIFFEELDPVIEEECKIILFENNISIKTFGKRSGHVKYAGEFNTDYIKEVLNSIIECQINKDINDEINKNSLFLRTPELCAGCPHRNSFLAINEASKGTKVIFTGDIGCYTLGAAKPISTTDTCLCMGASITMGQGIKIVEKDAKVFTFIGDSTFFHSGMTGIANAIYNNHNLVLCILDNLTTGMTGFQPHPGTGKKVDGTLAPNIEIEKVLTGLGIQKILILDPYENLEILIKKIKEFTSDDDICAIIFRRECINITKKVRSYKINLDKCIKCRICLYKTGCPAIFEEDNKIKIDTNICFGCNLCSFYCKHNAIEEA
ncbi:indolepyruvate ferredoxin oxidoreductase subunit alpha [Caldicellulosiruptoraceae bacterium PP1]